MEPAPGGALVGGGVHVGPHAPGVALRGLLALFAALRRLSPVRATMLGDLGPSVSILFAAAVLGERLGPSWRTGVALVVGALAPFGTVDRGRRTDGRGGDAYGSNAGRG